MGYDASVCRTYCRNELSPRGHNIVPVVASEDVDLVTKQVVRTYDIMCINCGMPISEIRTPPTPQKKTRAKRKPQIPEQEPVNEART
jgi:hypothetical protein